MSKQVMIVSKQGMNDEEGPKVQIRRVKALTGGLCPVTITEANQSNVKLPLYVN